MTKTISNTTFYIIFSVLFFAICVGSCSNSKKTKSLEAKIVSQDSTIKALVNKPVPASSLTAEEIRQIIKKESAKTMYDFLQYEDALDKKEITLSQIKVREKID
jgi:actin-related protein